ncbi:MAG: hypothetical protein JW809_09825 [Pirellulales bacterium]|nr:hypothetical protein [Pirellulales bacterium]
MALSKREKRLAFAAGALTAMVVVPLLFTGLLGPSSAERAQCDQLAEKVADQEERIARATKAQKKLGEWNRRSLPRDPQTARSLYQNWLLEQVTAVKFREPKVEAADRRPLGQTYDRLPFTVHGRGTLEQVTELLYRFYSAGHLHKIQRLTLTPRANTEELQVFLSIEALCLPQADRVDRLTEQPGARLAESSVEPYLASIAERKLFTAYQPPPPPRPPDPPPPPPAPPKPGFNHAGFLTLTGTGKVDGRPQAWLLMRTSGETAKVYAGEEFQFKEARGRVASVQDRSAELEVNGRRYLFQLGQTLKDAKLLADLTPAKPEPPAAPGLPPAPAEPAAPTEPSTASETATPTESAMPSEEDAPVEPASPGESVTPESVTPESAVPTEPVPPADAPPSPM